jgi:hypothetical protein
MQGFEPSAEESKTPNFVFLVIPEDGSKLDLYLSSKWSYFLILRFPLIIRQCEAGRYLFSVEKSSASQSDLEVSLPADFGLSKYHPVVQSIAPSFLPSMDCFEIP